MHARFQVSVHESDAMHPACLPIDQLLRECRFERTRRGGPGGQHRNKVDSAVVVTHLPSGISGQASERRSQHANRSVAIERLRLNLALAVRSSRRLSSDDGTSPPSFQSSPLWQTRSRGGKLSVSADHADYAALLAEALDVLTDCGFELPLAASVLNVSSSQLVRFLKATPAAFAWLNTQRVSAGLKPLK